MVKKHNFAPRKQILALTTKVMNLESTVGNETKAIAKKTCMFQEAPKLTVAARGWKVEKKHQIMGQSFHWGYE